MLTSTEFALTACAAEIRSVPIAPWGGLAFGNGSPVIHLQQPAAEQSFEAVERQTRSATVATRVAVQVAKKHLIHHAEESLNAASALRLARNREDQPHP